MKNTQQHLRGNRKVRLFVSDGFRHGNSQIKIKEAEMMVLKGCCEGEKEMSKG